MPAAVVMEHPAPVQQSRYLPVLTPYLTAGAGACFGSACVHPFEVVKTRLQVARVEVEWMQTERPRLSAFKMAKDVVSRDGIKGLYAGLSASLLRQSTYGTARIGLYTDFSERLRIRNGTDTLPLAQKAAAGIAAGGCAVLIGNPFDVALVRMQSDTLRPVCERRNYSGFFGAAKRIAADEGAGALFRGCSANILRGMAMNASMMATNDEARERLMRRNYSHPQAVLGAALISGGVCAVFSCPFDFVKSRLQCMRVGVDGRMPYRGPWDVIRRTATTEGVSAFFTGLGPYALRCAPHAVLTLVAREAVTSMLKGYA
eukprot:TRINITY_DN43962_c0_g1_i1.p1 TRINITY_DN43962_c0_g1~~TRINITY_DN43962_c0_g1_i1.p1  ORF type:complete len:331 (+),score=13.64 TRINITY_DN43962_c0_g1_i1:46-993(+)